MSYLLLLRLDLAPSRARVAAAVAVLTAVPCSRHRSRRTDFANFKGGGFTPLASYAASASLLRDRLATKLRTQSRFTHPPDDKPRLTKFKGVLPAEYGVLVSTDEPAGSPFRREIDAMGWRTIDHERMRTEDRLGPWWPSKLDGEMLARAQGLVGTEWSTFSMLAGLRVE